MKTFGAFLILGILICGRVSAEPETRTTTTGAVYTRDESMPALGEAWRDESGMIWGDIVKDRDGNVLPMNQYEAEEYCEKIGAELPTRDDFVRLRKSMGATSNDSAMESDGYSPQVLPHLGLDWWYWSSSIYDPFDPPFAAYGFFSFSGVISYAGRDKRHSYSTAVYVARCVGRR